MRHNTASFAAGFTVAALLFGGGTALAAAVLTATPSEQTFYVDGQQVEMEAYAINGHNYVQLRDVGRALGFGVTYDSATNSVQVDSSAPYEEETPAVPEGVTVVPQSDEPLILKEGDKVLCDDGTIYEITDMDLYQRNRPNGPEPLPTPTCDWSQFPELELPKVEVRYFSNEHGDNIFIRNLYETRRMQYTLYNAVANCPELWENGTLKLNSKGTPILRLSLEITEQKAVQPFWPWREVQLTQVFYSAPMAQFAVEAWDVFHNGKYLYTEYDVQGM